MNFLQRIQKSHYKLLNEHTKSNTRQRESQQENILATSTIENQM